MKKYIPYTLIIASILWIISSNSCSSLEVNPLKNSNYKYLGKADWPESKKEYWQLVSIHNHSVWNFEWEYTSEKTMVKSEIKDAGLFAKGEYAKMRNFEIAGYLELKEICEDENIDAAIFTEHNTIIHHYLVKKDKFPKLFNKGPLIILNGSEWTTDFAHINLFDYKYNGLHGALRPKSFENTTKSDVIEIIKQTRERGGFSIMNHPRLPDKTNKLFTPLGSDGLEVFGSAPGMTTDTRELWHKMLKLGHNWFAVASSDWHRSPYINFPPTLLVGHPDKYNLVRTSSQEVIEKEILQSIRVGHIQLTTLNSKKRLLKIIVPNGNGNCRAGDVCNIKAGKAYIKATNSSGLRLAIITENESFEQTMTIDEIHIDDYTVAVSFSKITNGAQFIRVELYDGGDLVHMSNPIYFK